MLIDTGATHSCICEDFMSACELNPEVLSSSVISVTSPLGSNSWTSDIVKSVDVVIDEMYMPIDMLVLFMSDFDVIFGMDWLTRYNVIIDCRKATLFFELNGITVRHELACLRPKFMPFMELWEKLRVAAISIEEKLTIESVPVVKEYVDVFPKDLPRLPLEGEIELVLC